MEQCGVLPSFHGIAMHDCWTSYWNYKDCRHAVCCAHLLRELTVLLDLLQNRELLNSRLLRGYLLTELQAVTLLPDLPVSDFF